MGTSELGSNIVLYSTQLNKNSKEVNKDLQDKKIRMPMKWM